jgi:von Willebrand factor type A C-terminal domain/von Willebrand factor type A domain
MVSAPDFTVDIFQNEYLPDGAREANAIVTVISAGSIADGPAFPASFAEIIIVDCSWSMDEPNTKLIQAREAAAAAIDVMRDGTAFAVVAGAGRAWPLYPKRGGLAIASAGPRAAAKRSVDRLRPHDGTAIGGWLRLARELFATREDTLRHAILLTDGQNEHESTAELDAAIELCVGVFSCDCRGVGTDWDVNRHVAHYTGQAELARAIQDGLEARKAGDDDTTAVRLGRAVALAHESGNDDTANLLAKVVDVIDPATGTVRLRATVTDADEMTLDTRSTKTARVSK